MRTHTRWGLPLLTLFSALWACGPSPNPDAADLVLTNGKVVTVDPDYPEAEAIAIKGFTIQAVGTTQEIAALVGPNTRTIDLDGRLAIPGLIDSHGHYMSLGHSKLILDLTQARTWEEIVAMVGEAAAQAEPA